MIIKDKRTVIDNALKALAEFPCDCYDVCEGCPLDKEKFCIADITSKLVDAKQKILASEMLYREE